MLFLLSCIDPKGEHLHLSYEGSFESGFAGLTYMVNLGWQLLVVDFIDEDKTLISIPTGTFYRKLPTNPLVELRQE